MTETFGWYLSLKTLAESGLFNLPNHSPMKSAQLADLYEALYYLSSLKAEGKFLENLYTQK